LKDYVQSISIAPKHARAGDSARITITLKIGNKGLPENSCLKLVIPFMWTLPWHNEEHLRKIEEFYRNSRLVPKGSLYITVHASDKTKIEVKEIKKWRYVTFKVVSSYMSGEEINIIYGDQSKKGKGAKVQSIAMNKVKFSLFIDSFKKGEFKYIENSPVLTVSPNIPERIKMTLPSLVQTGQRVSMKVSIQDKFGNSIPDFKGTIRFIFPEKIINGLPRQYSFIPENKGKMIFPLIFQREGVYRIKAEGGRKDIIGQSNPAYVQREVQKRLFWGDIHGHSELSDGACSIDFYYTYAKEMAHFDFSALTDHGHQGPHPFFEGILTLSDWDWKLIRKKANEYYKPGEFVTFSGYEWTGKRDGKSIEEDGDRNVYYLYDTALLYKRNNPDSITALNLWDKLKNENVIIIPHHPAHGQPGEYGMGTDWKSYNLSKEPVVEIYSMHGSSECRKSSRSLIAENGTGYVQNAWAKGYKLGVVAGSDSHTRPDSPVINNNYPTLQYPPGLTAIYARELSRISIMQAIRERHCYGTTGERIILEFTVNGYRMGDEFSLSSSREERKIKISVVGTDKISKIEIIRNNIEIYVYHGSKLEENITFIDRENLARPLNYYYTKIIQEDDAMAWTSPVWVIVKK